MSNRRAARAAGAQGQARGPAPRLEVTLLADPRDPRWRDPDVLERVFGQLFDDAARNRLLIGGRPYQHIIGRWALAHGFSSQWRSAPDWRALTAYLDTHKGAHQA